LPVEVKAYDDEGPSSGCEYGGMWGAIIWSERSDVIVEERWRVREGLVAKNERESEEKKEKEGKKGKKGKKCQIG